MFKAAFRAADHRKLKPWRFLVIKEEGLEHLGRLFLAATEYQGGELNEEARTRLLLLPQRAPLIVVAIASTQDDPKVPVQEQLLSTGAAVQNMLNAAFAMGLGAIWRTGDLASNEQVKAGLGLSVNEQIVAFLYLGAPRAPFREPPVTAIADHVGNWP